MEPMEQSRDCQTLPGGTRARKSHAPERRIWNKERMSLPEGLSVF
jgi:hypothetical protein